MFLKIGVLKNFTVFIGKHLCSNHLCNRPAALLKRDSTTQVFPCEHCEIFFIETEFFYIKHNFYRTPLLEAVNPLNVSVALI